MSINLLNVFNSKDFKDAGKKTSDLNELTFKVNPTTDTRFVRAVFEDGSALVRQVSEEVVCENVMQFPKIASISQRTEIIKELHKDYTQQDIAAILDVSQATVSAALHIVNRKENNHENH